MNFLKKLDLGDRGYPLFFRFLLTVKPVRVRNVLRLTLPNLWEPWKKTLNSFISQQRGNMVEQRECLIDFIFMYYCYIWPSKGFFSLRCFFSRTLLLRVLVGVGVIGNHIVLSSATPQNLPEEVVHKMYGEEGLHMSAL